MPETSAIDLATEYVAASNAHDLDSIADILAADGVYQSSKVGEHRGAKAICMMMEKFFAGYPDVQWKVKEYHSVGTAGAAFDFFMTATDAQSGERIERRGHERIFISSEQKIIRVEVEA